MRIDARWTLGITAILLLLAGGNASGEDAIIFRWDLVHIIFHPTGNEIFAGGSDSALAQDGSKITLTGSGTFEAGEADEVTGGGTWETFSSAGATTGTGTYKVTRLIRFEGAPGVQTRTAIDHIGDGTLKDNRAGLVALLIRYSDGSKGVLFVSCDIPGNPGANDGAPASMFEGVTASKGFTDYWNHVGPVAGVDSGRTLFHVIPRQNTD
jgi:hypothetical protein